MNYTETFDQFASRMSTTDLAIYAGAGLILWVLFKDQLSPVQKFLGDLIGKIKNLSGSKVVAPTLPVIKPTITNKEDIFFRLVVSWKQTRDLAAECECEEAVKVADQMFPYLSPIVCTKGDSK